MKTLRISDNVHQKLTALLGELMTQISKMQKALEKYDKWLKAKEGVRKRP
ncbi:MAG: hypothetical protein QXS01_06045 [Candidatus Bathyarchaeia archaeon]